MTRTLLPAALRRVRQAHRVLFVLLLTGVAALLAAAPASAHVVPAIVVELDVHAADITADITLPAGDLATASGITLTDTELSAATARQVADYLTDHLSVSTADGSQAWAVTVADVTATQVEQYGTGKFSAVTATATLTPPTGADLRSFVLTDDAIVHQVVTADTYVLLGSDWAAGQTESTRTLGTITTDTITGTVPALTVSLDQGSAWQGFSGMVTLGVSHIADGTDHQLFLLTLLLPAPLLATRGRWRGVVTPHRAVRRITTITLAFTVGHSITLALGTLGLPVPQQPVEAAIAVSILIAAAHALRPLFPGREPLIAGLFGLVHGMAFSTTLASMKLTGSQLALSLLGFNLGIEAMQLVVVLLVLPPLLVLARTPAYRPVRIIAALVTSVAAAGWLLDRVGVITPLAGAADQLGPASPWIAGALWIAAGVVLARGRHTLPPADDRPSRLPTAHARLTNRP